MERTRTTAIRYRTMLTAGVSRGRLRVATESGHLVRHGRGVYARGDCRLDQIGAAALRLGDDSVVSHETAAELWGLPILGRAPAAVQVSRPRRGTGRERYPGLTVHHAALPASHRTSHLGVPVTTPARTVVDLARTGSFRQGVVVADGALRLRRCTPDDLAEVAAACAGWPGVRRARQVVAFGSPRAASPLESISRVAFHTYGLPRPLLQAEMPSLDIVDFLWDEYGVVGEADGMSKYVDPDALRREKARQERLVEDGLIVVRWTWREVYHRPDAVAHRVGVSLHRMGWAPGSSWA